MTMAIEGLRSFLPNHLLSSQWRELLSTLPIHSEMHSASEANACRANLMMMARDSDLLLLQARICALVLVVRHVCVCVRAFMCLPFLIIQHNDKALCRGKGTANTPHTRYIVYRMGFVCAWLYRLLVASSCLWSVWLSSYTHIASLHTYL